MVPIHDAKHTQSLNNVRKSNLLLVGGRDFFLTPVLPFFFCEDYAYHLIIVLINVWMCQMWGERKNLGKSSVRIHILCEIYYRESDIFIYELQNLILCYQDL